MWLVESVSTQGKCLTEVLLTFSLGHAEMYFSETSLFVPVMLLSFDYLMLHARMMACLCFSGLQRNGRSWRQLCAMRPRLLASKPRFSPLLEIPACPTGNCNRACILLLWARLPSKEEVMTQLLSTCVPLRNSGQCGYFEVNRSFSHGLCSDFA